MADSSSKLASSQSRASALRNSLAVMDPKGTARLREEQLRAIKETKQKLDALNKYLTDYDTLVKRLKTLPEKTRHDVMVPFGKFAFMPGHLVHTNEILVLLGDNWFCERSAKQAAEIAEHRTEALKKQMNDLEKQKTLLEPRLDFTRELQDILEEKSDVIEIKEDYDAEAEKAWKEKHRENVKAHKSRMRALREKASQSRGCAQEDISKGSAEDSNAAVWRRLEELELQEKKNREMLTLCRMENASGGYDQSALSSIPLQTGSNRKKQVKWKDLHDATATADQQLTDTELESSGTDSESSGTDSRLIGSESDDGSPAAPLKTITFTHTPMPPLQSQVEENANKEEHDIPLIMSPADIYTHFVHTSKSILKSPSDTFVQKPGEIWKKKPPHQVVEMCNEPGEPEPFTGTVVEKLPQFAASQEGEHGTNMSSGHATMSESLTGDVLEKAVPSKHKDVEANQSHDISCNQKPAKKVSRFKAQQMKKSH